MPSRVAALVLLAAVSCGGTGSTPRSSGSPSPSAMSKAEYVTAANAICARFNTEAGALPEPKDPDEFATVMRSLLDLMDRGQKELRALAPPAADRADVETKFLQPNEAQAAALRASLPDIEAAAKADDEAAATAAFATAFEKMGDLAEAQDTFAKDYGLTECAE